LQVDLVGTNAEAANDNQVLSVLEHVGSELGLGSDTNDVHVLDLLDQLVLGERALESLDLVLLSLEDGLAGLVDVLEEQDLNVLGVEGLELLGLGLRLACTEAVQGAVEGGSWAGRDLVGAAKGVRDGGRESIIGVAAADGDVAGCGGHCCEGGSEG
jgi:hypothetical protein